jgi:bifunctional non-homologous end joining protein LigD
VLRTSPFIIPSQPAERIRPPAGDAWLHEVKFDGYRCQLHKAGNDIVIFSKNGRDFTNRFPGIRDAVLTLPCKSAIIDGEVVACKNDGTPDFRALHSGNYSQEILCVWAFDLMEINGEDLRPSPLVARKRKLETLLRRHDHPYVRYSEPFKNGEQLLAECRQRGLEGVVSKRKQAPYKSGKCDWIKVKCAQWIEANKNRGDLFIRPR